MLSDYILISLFFWIILLIFLGMKYFRVLLFYLWIFLGFFLAIFWRFILEKSWFNFGFLNNIWSIFSEFFKDSEIMKFFLNNMKLVLFLVVSLLFYKVLYYVILILIYFIKWLFSNIINWVSNRKKKIDTIAEEKKE